MAREIILIAAMDKHRAIGKDNGLPWHLPDDLKRFKQLTVNRTIVMGRKTAESLGRALPKRTNLVLTRTGEAPFAGMRVVRSTAEALALVDQEDLFVIGGGEIYALFLPIATRLHLTEVDTLVVDADTHFPSLDFSQWQLRESHAHVADQTHAHGFIERVWQRRIE